MEKDNDDVDDESSCKKIKSEDVKSFHVNDILKLVFGEHQIVKPTYTHQLFENEEFSTAGLTLDCNLEDFEIEIFVDCHSLAQTIIRSSSSAVISSAIESKLEPILTVGNVANHEPPGELIASYENDGGRYEMYLASNIHGGASSLVSRCEKLAKWFIETADSVDFTDDCWECLILYQFIDPLLNELEKRRVFVGYMTLFTFNNPFKGSKMRVCQALVLPTRQGQGFGKDMLLCVYALAAKRQHVVEVTVEDPAEGFQCLRDWTDITWALISNDTEAVASDKTLSQILSYNRATTVTSSWKDSIISKDQYAIPDPKAFARRLKITPSQAQFVLDVFKYMALFQHSWNEQLDCDCSDVKAFRLEIKRRLRSAHVELKNVSKEQIQKILHELYLEQFVRYERIVKSLAKESR